MTTPFLITVQAVVFADDADRAETVAYAISTFAQEANKNPDNPTEIQTVIVQEGPFASVGPVFLGGTVSNTRHKEDA